ncbi:tachykinin-like peptides receptor 86C [Ptychodera flava]|uniref:tachykinin-like peptides receptor 86C n=1 Tax=Ptychodera flava TaxID=63121 RepID=UPI00396A74A6
MVAQETRGCQACREKRMEQAGNYSSNSSVYPWSLPTLPDGRAIALSTVFAIGVGVSAVSNIVVAWVLIVGGRKKRSFNVFLLNLAVSDWTLSTVCLPFMFESTLSGEWIFGEAMCTAIPFILKVSQIVSIFSLVAIGLDRYRAVMYPLQPTITPRKKLVAIIAIWCAAILLTSPKLKYLTMIQFSYGGKTFRFCAEKWPKRSPMVTYVWVLFTLTYMIPLVVLLVCYLRMGVKLVRGQLPGCADERRDKLQKRAKRKVGGLSSA